MDRSGHYIEGDTDQIKIGPRILGTHRHFRGVRRQIVMQLRNQTDARQAFLDPFGLEAHRIFMEAGCRTSSGRNVVSDLCLTDPGDPHLYRHPVSDGLGGSLSYDRRVVERCLQRLLNEYSRRTDGRLSDSLVKTAFQLMEQCMKDQIEGKRLEEVGLTFAQVKVLRESAAFKAHSRYAEFEARFAALQRELEATRRKAFFESEVLDWHGPKHQQRYHDSDGRERVYNHGPEGDQAHEWNAKTQSYDVSYDPTKMQARLQETLNAYLEATGGTISEDFIQNTLELAGNYSSARPDSEKLESKWLSVLRQLAPDLATHYQERALPNRPLSKEVTAKFLAALGQKAAQRYRAMMSNLLRTRAAKGPNPDLIRRRAYRHFQSVLRNPQQTLQYSQLRVLLNSLSLIQHPGYMALMKKLARVHPDMPHPWTSRLFHYYKPHPWAEERCGGTWELLPGLDQTALPLLDALIKDDGLWRARNQKARDDLFRSIGEAVASIGKGHMSRRYAPDKGTFEERLTLLRQNLKYKGPLALNAVADTFRTDEEKVKLRKAIEAETDPDFADVLRRILAERWEGIMHWSRTVQRECTIGGKTFLQTGVEHDQCRVNPWDPYRGLAAGA